MYRPLIILLAVVLAIFPGFALCGQISQKKLHYCQLLENAFVTAASTRDDGMSPKQSYATLMGGIGSLPGKPISSQKIKKIVNLIFFDPRFTYAGGHALGNQVFNSCMGIRQYKPLK